MWEDLANKLATPIDGLLIKLAFVDSGIASAGVVVTRRPAPREPVARARPSKPERINIFIFILLL